MTDFVSPPYALRKTLMERLEDALLPLINLVFLLLMFFIIAGHLQNHSLPELPGTTSDQSRERTEADLIVQADGQWQVQGRAANSADLANLLPPADSRPTLSVAAAANMSMQDLESLLELLSNQGYEDVILLTEPARQ